MGEVSSAIPSASAYFDSFAAASPELRGSRRISTDSITFGGLPGVRVVYDYRMDNRTIRADVTLVLKGHTAYVLTCSSLPARYENGAAPRFNEIVKSFALDKP